jgi:RES domain-containing protein
VVTHDHQPLYRIARANWADPLDASFSQAVLDNRWNTTAFPALYCCCSLPVARAVALYRLRRVGAVLDDLAPGARPRLVEIGWQGDVVDVASAAGVAAAGFPDTYPRGVTVEATQSAAARWHEAGKEGVVCRSHALVEMASIDVWSGDHIPWGEVAVFPRQAREAPRRIRDHADLGWLTGFFPRR